MKRLLILDDDVTVLHLASRALQQPGLEVITCREPEAAEAILDSVGVDLMLTDLRVSPWGGLDGVRLIKHLATHFPEMSLVAMSGDLSEPVVSLCRREGASAVFPKPLNLPALSRHVAAQLWPAAPKPERSDPGRVADLEELDPFLAERSIQALFQPIVALGPGGSAGQPFGFEALARGPEDSLLRNPELLFAYASRKGRLYETDLLCIRAALSEAARLPADARLFLNVQPRSMSRPGFAEAVGDLLEASRLSPNRIVIELTEQQTILNPHAFSAALAALRARGLQVALDDFGVGFSNLQLVDDLRPEFLKISGHFCRHLASSRPRQRILASTARMAADLGIATILEQVETAAERDQARALGVDYAPGYFYARPARALEWAAPKASA